MLAIADSNAQTSHKLYKIFIYSYLQEANNCFENIRYCNKTICYNTRLQIRNIKIDTFVH